MVKQVKLKGQVRLNMDHTFTFFSTIYDKTPLEITVSIHDFELMDEFEPSRYMVDGWLFAVQEAQQDTRCYLTLPKASTQFGRQIVVHEWQLTPRVSTIADFKPKVMGGVKEATPEKHKKERKKASKV